MKLLLLSDLNSIHTKKWIKGISENGIEVLVFGLSKPIDDFYDTINNVKIAYSNFNDQYTGGVLKKVSYFKVVSQLKKIAKEFKPDIVHAHYATSYGMLGTFLKHNNFIISVWGTDVYDFPKKSWLHRQILKRNLSKTKQIFSTSKDMALETKKYTNKIINVVPFGVDVNAFTPISKAETVKTIIGVVKTLEPVYGIEYLIKAFNKLSQKYNNIELLIVGDGSLKNSLKALVNSNENKVSFIGRIKHEEVPIYFSKMDIVVIPSLQESFGVAAVEASACEKPIIVSNVGGLPEVVIDGETGYVCEPKNIDCLVRKLKKLIDNPDIQKVFGEAGRKNVLKKYNWDANVDLMITHYKSLV